MKLKPCPFCGSEPELGDASPPVDWRPLYAVQCYGCGVRGPKFRFKNLAAQGWNKMCRKEES